MDTVSILGESSLLNLPITAKARIISPFTTRPYEAQTLRQLLEQVICDIGQNAMYVEETIATALEPYAGKSVVLSVMGKTQYLAYLEQAFSERNIDYSVLSHKTGSNPNGRSGSGAVAIVGMSGRFPGSDSVDQLWSNLLAGKEFTTKVISCYEKNVSSTDSHSRSRGPGSMWTSTTTRLIRYRTLLRHIMELF